MAGSNDSGELGANVASDGSERFRTLGLDAGSFGPLSWTVDDLELVESSLAGSDARAAFVALVIHDPELTDRTIDGARWAIEMLQSARASVFTVLALAQPQDPGPLRLEPRQWNHAIAMVEELRRQCHRRGLAFESFERFEGDPIEVALVGTTLPVVGLDPCSYQAEGWRPTRLGIQSSSAAAASS